MKDSWDGDEMYSYSLSNSPKGGFITANISSNNWLTSEDIMNTFTVSNENRFNYKSVYRNQQADVHPPFYYAIFHTISSVFPNTFSKWIGLSINILSFMVTILFLYLISKKLLKNTRISCLVCLLFGISIGTISNLLFIRMYMLFTMFSTIFTYLVLSTYLTKNKYNYIFLTICTFLGFMTHYYFLVYAFFISAIYSIYLFINKDIKSFIKYAISIFAGIIFGFLLFPTAYNHIFKGYRGTQSTTNLLEQSFITKFKSLSDTLSNEIFFNQINILLPIFIIICLLFIISLLKNHKKNSLETTYILFILLSILLYITIVIKMEPIITTRYIWNIYPFIPLVVIYMINYLLSKIKYKKILLPLSIVILSILAIYNLLVTTPEYLTNVDSNK